jgi:signal transduction histidine kinase/ActR/RegA family two-component response regulator
MHEILRRIRNGEKVEHFETVRRRRDGVEIHVSLSVSPIRNDRGEIIGASKIARDISEQARLASELEEANRLKDEFLATLSHELRTPLHSILGYTQILQHGMVDEDRRDNALQIIERNAKTLAQLVSDVLDISRIVTGKVRLETADCDLAPIVSAALDSVQPTFDAKGVRLDRRLAPGPTMVLGDPARLQQIVWNLLTNAIKFTPAGGNVEVRLSRTSATGPGVRRQAELVVSDSGAGISPEFLPHLFERFRQGDSRSTRHHGGLGIGLALVRHFTELHGGSVEAESEGPGCGATFRLHLPLLASSLANDSDEENDQSQAHVTERLSHVTVLAVDDDADSLQLLDEILSSAGATVLCASSAAAGLRLLDIQLPDVIVSDLGMPGRDGFDFIKSVRQRGQSRGGAVPAAALTAYVRPADRLRALAAGFQMHLGKPIDPEMLVQAVDQLRSRLPTH